MEQQFLQLKQSQQSHQSRFLEQEALIRKLLESHLFLIRTLSDVCLEGSLLLSKYGYEITQKEKAGKSIDLITE